MDMNFSFSVPLESMCSVVLMPSLQASSPFWRCRLLPLWASCRDNGEIPAGSWGPMFQSRTCYVLHWSHWARVRPGAIAASIFHSMSVVLIYSFMVCRSSMVTGSFHSSLFWSKFGKNSPTAFLGCLYFYDFPPKSTASLSWPVCWRHSFGYSIHKYSWRQAAGETGARVWKFQRLQFPLGFWFDGPVSP